MEIDKISFLKGQGSIFWERTLDVFQSQWKEIVVFLMPNNGGKSLAFNWMKHLLTWDPGNYIKDVNPDIWIKVEFRINNESYTYRWGYQTFMITDSQGKELDNHEFDELLRWEFWLGDEVFKYCGNTKTSLKSLNRYVFFHYQGFSDDDRKNYIELINAKFDWASKKLLLAYVLWADISEGMFAKISNYEREKEFINIHKWKFGQYETQAKLLDQDQDTLMGALFETLQEHRFALGDAAIARKRLVALMSEYATLFWQANENYVFLDRELKFIERAIGDETEEIKRIKKKMKNMDLLEKDAYLEKTDEKVWTNESQLLDLYKKYLSNISETNEDELYEYYNGHILPYLADYKSFLSKLYEQFLSTASWLGIAFSIDAIPKDAIIFDEQTLNIKINFPASEWMRKTIRLLTFFWLHTYARVQKICRCYDVSFYNSFIESMDTPHRKALFLTMLSFVESQNIKFPKIFLFVSETWDANGFTEWLSEITDKVQVINTMWLLEE